MTQVSVAKRVSIYGYWRAEDAAPVSHELKQLKVIMSFANVSLLKKKTKILV